MTLILPREYQQRAIHAGVNNVFNGNVKNGLILMPTGTGKSVVIGGTVRAIREAYPPARILMLTHVKELVAQNYDKATKMVNQRIGLWSAGLKKKEHHQDIVFAGIDTVARNPDLLKTRHIVLIDEAHRVSHKPNTTYRNVYEVLREINPNIMSLGYTATGYRSGQGKLTDAWHNAKTQDTIAPFWDDVLLDLTSPDEFNKFFNEGFLKRVVPKPTSSEIDVTKMRQIGDEYNKDDVDAEVNNAAKVRAIVDEICDEGFDRRSWLVFAAGNKNAKIVAAEIAARGVTVAVLTDDNTAAERDKIISAYKRYEIRCLVNNDILTTGFDHEGVDLLAIVRVTNSASLWVQMLGRGTRPVYAAGFDLSTVDGRLMSIFASGVYNCKVLDFAGNSKRLGTINNPVIPTPPEKRKKSSAGDCPVKICPHCGTYNVASARFCENVQYCGKEFPLSEELEVTAGVRELIDEKEHVPDIRTLAVTSVTFDERVTQLASSTVSVVRAKYGCGKNGRFEETLTFNGDKSTARTKAWWLHFGDGTEIPSSNAVFVKFYSSSRIKRLRVLKVYMNPPRKARPEITYYGFEDASVFEAAEHAAG